jgi:DNA-binding Lrp family transcriptional regulator
MDKGYCHAEQTRIAEQLGVTRETVNRAIKVLVSGGYIEDSTPNTKGRTRIYKDTGKAGLAVYFEPVSVPVSEVVSEVVSEPVRLSHTKIVKTEKKEKTHTNESEVFFLENASQEQKNAYQLVRKVASVDKAIEKAESEYPMQAAYDYIEWSAEHGNKVADIILSGLMQSGEFYGDDFLKDKTRMLANEERICAPKEFGL